MYLYKNNRTARNNALRMTFLFVTIALLTASCRGRQSPAPPLVDQQVIQDTLSVSGYSIHRVKLPYAHAITDRDGNTKRYGEAWLIKLRLQDAPRISDERIDFAIGDYTVPEYGGWKGGIYFRIYERELLEQLDQQMIRYKFPGADAFVASGLRLNARVDMSMKVEDEKEALGRD